MAKRLEQDYRVVSVFNSDYWNIEIGFRRKSWWDRLRRGEYAWQSTDENFESWEDAIAEIKLWREKDKKHAAWLHARETFKPIVMYLDQGTKE